MTRTSLHTITTSSLVVLASFVFAGSAQAQSLVLPDTPLFLSNTVEPNIILAIDDSGSMNDEVLLPANDGSAWWRTGTAGGCTAATAQSFTGCISDGTDDVPAPGVLNFNRMGNAGGVWRNYTYLFPNGQSGSYDGRLIYDDGGTSTTITNKHYSIPPIPAFGWARSPAYNPAYFDPSQNYSPWVTFTVPYGNITPSNAPSDPTRTTPTFDLTRDRASNQAVGPSYASVVLPGNLLSCPLTGAGYDATNNANFRQEPGMVLPAGTCYYNTGKIAGVTIGWQTATSDVSVTAFQNAAIRYFPATFYLPAGTALPAGYGYTGPTTPAGLSPDGKTSLDHYEIKRENFASQAQYDDAIQNFANWFTYYRKRHLAMRGGVGAAFKDLTGLRVDAYTINNRTAVTMRDLSIASDKNALFERIYGSSNGNAFVGSGGTPNRTAVKFLGDQFKRKDSTAPIQTACQQNFGILFTDGYSNGSSDTAFSAVGNVDGTTGAFGYGTAPFTDGQSATMADGAASLYRNNLRPDLQAGVLPVPLACSSANPDPRLDCNKNLHMNFYGVTLGTRGNVFGVDALATADPYANPPTWPTNFPDRSPTAVDDLWHATINARGQLFNARTPLEIADGLSSVLRGIAAQIGSSSSLTLNSASVSSGTLVFQSSFNSANWTGQLQAIPVSTGIASTRCPNQAVGELCDPIWSAAAVLDKQNYDTGRVILSYKPSTRSGIAFRWANLDPSEQALLNIDDNNVADTNGALRLRYIRGDRTQESATAKPSFRPRATVLGDLVDSDPVFVGAPSAGYSFDNYATFRSEQSGRTPMTYIAGNDGMLHGFRAETGEEAIAYVPSKAFGTSAKPLLAALTRRSFVHRFIVDGSPAVGDAFLGGVWKTILVGGMRSGGQGLYALDVTDPSPAAFSESKPSTVLWEFTNDDDPDLGYTFSKPVIVKLNNGRWAALVGNGYNSGGTGRSTLFILYLDPGAGGWVLGTNYFKISTGVGSTGAPNGLASPAPIDINRDGVVDYVYAGDQSGRMWRFNLTGGTPSGWVVAYSGQPLFKATDSSGATQAITERPEVGFNLLATSPTVPTSPKLTVFFGTGQYLTAGDNTQAGQPTQTFYGIFDNFDSVLPIDRSELQQQQILQEVQQNGSACVADADCFRVTTNNSVNVASPSNQKGWYIDLFNTVDKSVSGPNRGERQVTAPTLRGGRIVFTTLIPSADPCQAGGSSFLMELDAKTGSRLETSAIDANRNGTIDSGDNITTTIDGKKVTVALSGVSTGGGVSSSVNILDLNSSPNGSGKELKLTGQSNGSVNSRLESTSGRRGRITWREIIR